MCIILNSNIETIKKGIDYKKEKMLYKDIETKLKKMNSGTETM